VYCQEARCGYNTCSLMKVSACILSVELVGAVYSPCLPELGEVR
jgi:hypothetical protein